MKLLNLLKEKKNIQIFLFLLILGLSFYIRYLLLPYESSDMTKYILNWLQYYRDFSWWHTLKSPISNYSAPYNYFLLLIHFLQRYGNIQFGDVVMIKSVSIFFDYFAALIVGFIVYYRRKDFLSFVIGFGAVLFAPTIILNSSHWGQCDVIYSTFIAASVFFIAKDKSFLSVIAFGIAFAFKSQAIFLAPFILLMFLAGDIKWWHSIVFVVSYLAMNFPTIYVKVPIIEILTIYFNQAGSQWRMTYNAPNIYQFFVHIFRLFNSSINIYYDNLRYVSMGLTAIISIGYSFKFAPMIKKGDTNANKVKLALLSLLIVPFFLPAMHERYFFSADLLSIVIPFYDKKYIPLLVQGASLGAYINFYMTPKFINSYPSFIGMLLASSAIFLLIRNLEQSRKMGVQIEGEAF